MKLSKLLYKELPGVEIVLSGKAYIVPPMNFATLIAVMPQIKGLEGVGPGRIPTKAQLSCITKIIHRALRRNYPFLSYRTVFNGLDMQTMGDNLTKVMNGSGAKPAGEAKAGNQ